MALSNQCNWFDVAQNTQVGKILIWDVSMAKVEISLMPSPRWKDQDKVIWLDEILYQKLMDKSLDWSILVLFAEVINIICK